MLKKIVLAVVVVIVVLLVVIALQPAEFQVTRAATMAAPPAAVFAQVNDFHRWTNWSPWEHLDPAMKKTFEGTPEGVGTIYAWSGNKDVGTGRMEVTESRPAELVKIDLQFIEPFAASNVAEFHFTPEGGGTAVRWTMSGRKNFLSKAFCMFMSMDKMVGGDFEKGLAQLKTVVESQTQPHA